MLHLKVEIISGIYCSLNGVKFQRLREGSLCVVEERIKLSKLVTSYPSNDHLVFTI